MNILSEARGLEASNIYREIFKFRENMSKTDFAKFLKVFIKSRNLNISRKYLHIRNLQTTCLKVIYNMFNIKSLKIFEQPFRSHCVAISRKLLKKSRNQNTFPIFKMNLIRC